MSIITAFYFLVNINPLLVSFLFSLVSEELIIFLAILSGKGNFLPSYIFLGALVGFLLIDNFYFLIGRTTLIHKIKNHNFVKKTTEKLPNFIKKVGERNMFLEIFFTKFIYGTRTAAIISISNKKISYRKFAISDFLAIFLWLSIIIPIGWLSGRGIVFFLVFFKGAEKFLLISLIIVLIYFLVIKNIISRKINQSS